MILKPFNLEDAKAGKPIVTTTGEARKFMIWESSARKPIVTLDGRGEWIYYYADGRHCQDDGCGQDLVMAPEKRTVWVNVYSYDLNANLELALKNHAGHAWGSEETANHPSLKQGRIACIPVTFTEGDGL